MFIDTHCHISTDYYENIDEVILENNKHDVFKMIVSGCDDNSIKESLELIDKYDCIYATIGYHPSEANLLDSIDFDLLENLISNNKKIIGVGEIGLDYHYGDDRKEQIELFERQLAIAEKLNLPVVIHSREATQDTINCLKKFKVKGVIHCFNGSLETASSYIKIGFKLGIGGVLTFKNCKLSETLEKIDVKNIVLETDSPYLTPVPYREKVNSSKYIPIIAEKVAEIKNISIQDLSKTILNNTYEIFNIN